MTPLIFSAALLSMVATGIAVLGGTGNLGGYIAFGSLLFVVAIVYLAPSMILYRKGNRRRAVALAVNVFCGWLGIPWLLLLVWAYRQPREVPAQT